MTEGSLERVHANFACPSATSTQCVIGICYACLLEVSIRIFYLRVGEVADLLGLDFRIGMWSLRSRRPGWEILLNDLKIFLRDELAAGVQPEFVPAGTGKNDGRNIKAEVVGLETIGNFNRG